MRIKKIYFLLIVFLAICFTSIAQSQFKIWSGNLGGAIYKQDFGFGDSDVSIAGPALPAGITVFPYSNDVCPPAGSYSIVQKVNVNNCSNGKWLLLSSDHNLQVNHGNMMLVHNIANSFPRVVYVDTVNESLCAGVMYEFSAAIINVDAKKKCSPFPDFPAFNFTVENSSGQAIQSYTTAGISAAPAGTTAGPLWKFSIYGFDFVMPSNMNKIVLRITLLGLGSNINCNNDFAIDDILFSPTGPIDQITFNGMDPGAILTGVCFQDNKTIQMNGSIDPFYNNLAIQWEKSTDNGLTWKDIPGAMSSTYSQSFSVPDTFLFRMRGSEGVNITKPGCGVVSNVLKVEVDGIPTNVKISNNSPICSGDDLTFIAEGGASYTWSGPNGFYDDIATPHIFHSSLNDSGTYYAQIKTYGGCVATDSTHVIMKGVPDIIAGPDTSICKGNSVKLNCTRGASYSWTPAEGLSSVSIPDPVATPQVSTKYTVKVSDGNGCSNTGTVDIKLLNSIVVKAIISGSNFVCRPVDTVSFFNESIGEIAKSQWNFGNGKSSALFNPLPINYTVADNITDYSIRLAVTDSAGCSDTVFHVMKVENNCYIAVPTAFTPNGDGLNDYLYPLNAYKATDLTFRVFNRLGQLVFQTNDWTKKWDGTVKGEPQPLGVYVWMLLYTDANKKEVSLKGSTLLIR
jgi:gliding motility-associated-like protein